MNALEFIGAHAADLLSVGPIAVGVALCLNRYAGIRLVLSLRLVFFFLFVSPDNENILSHIRNL